MTHQRPPRARTRRSRSAAPMPQPPLAPLARAVSRTTLGRGGEVAAQGLQVDVAAGERRQQLSETPGNLSAPTEGADSDACDRVLIVSVGQGVAAELPEIFARARSG